MRRHVLPTLGFTLLLLAPAAAAPSAAGTPAPASFAMVGSIKNPGSLTFDDLTRLDGLDLAVSQETDNGPAQATFHGVLLWTLVEQAGLVNGPEKNAYIQHTILVTGADGYAAAVSEGEIDPKLEGKKVMVAFMKDGKLLDGMQLVVPGDAHAARGVHEIASIDVK